MAKSVKRIPEGFRTITAHLDVRDAAKALEFYKKAFNAKEIERMSSPDGSWIMHAEMTIGDSRFMLNDIPPGMGSHIPATFTYTPVKLHLYVEDADAFFAQAVEMGAEVVHPLMNTFWGDRYGMIKDPFGHHWGVATHLEDLSLDEQKKRADEWFKTQKM